MIILLFFAFISGLFTILAPCIWPILPLILSTSLGSKSHLRPLGIIVGIMTSFSVFTLSISTVVSLFHFDPNILRLTAAILIAFFGLTMIIPRLSLLLEKLGMFVNWFGGGRLNREKKDTDFMGGFLTGLVLGIIWSPCAGAILATIATLSITSQLNFYVVLLTVSYVSGIGIPLFAFAHYGQRLIQKFSFLSPQTGRLQQLFGIITILTAILIYTNYDKVLQAKLLDFFPQYNNVLTGFENTKTVRTQLDKLRNKKAQVNDSTVNNFSNYGQAPEFVGITKWLNSNPLTMSDLKGKVILVDFWTYTCINCIRTLPHVVSWYNKYKDMGFVVVGVHTPEFEFEKDTKNVENAIKQYHITYPIAQDNNYQTWTAYDNHYWPAEYLIDAKGVIRRVHFEGEYAEEEKAIQELIKESGKNVEVQIDNMKDETPKMRLSPETYLGANRMEYLYPSGRVGEGKKEFKMEEVMLPNTFSFGGEWLVTSERSVSGINASITYNFYAQKVFLVMRPPKNVQNVQVRVYIDGKIVSGSQMGTDVKEGVITLDSDRLYNLIKLGSPEQHVLKLQFLSPGIEVYAFTFG